MWPDRRLLELFKTEFPILLAPMAGAMDQELAIAAAQGGALPSIPCALIPTEKAREQVNILLGALPTVNPRDLHALGDALGRDESAFAAFVDAVRDWLSARVTAARAEPSRLARFAEVWDRLNKAARDVEIFHLERKPMVFNVFGWLAEASRG